MSLDGEIQLTGKNAKLMSALITARAAIDGLLLELASEESPKAVAEAVRVTSDNCKHEQRKEMMGGHWWCPVCGASG